MPTSGRPRSGLCGCRTGGSWRTVARSTSSPPSDTVIVLVVLLLAAAAVSLYDAARRPTLRRLAMRNVGRRRGEALLVVAGSLLGTAIITASFIVGDSLGASVRDSARTQLGPIDEVVATDRPADLDRVAAAVRGSGLPGTDGTL